MTATRYPFQNNDVADVFQATPEPARQALLILRDLIFDTARAIPDVGRVEEALRWRQPAYLTPETRSGTTIRLGAPTPESVALYVHCQTTLIRDFRDHAPDGLRIEGNRAVHIEADAPLPLAPLAHLVRAALTYHVAKR